MRKLIRRLISEGELEDVLYVSTVATYSKRGEVVDAWMYPRTLLSTFEAWIERVYVPQKLAVYIKRTGK